MFVNQHMIKVCFRDDDNMDSFNTKMLRGYKSPDKDNNSDDVISLKYTIDYPRVELHPFDTKKFQLFYADTKVNAKYDCNRCIEMRAGSRQARDIIALLIRCFSAQTYFINSKIIANVTDGSYTGTEN